MLRYIIGSTLGLLVLASLASCGDEKNDGGSEANAMQYLEVCGDTVDCGTTCTADDSCPDGQFCDEDNRCYAECTPNSGCLGTCGGDGRCNGSRQTVVSRPAGNSDNGPLLVGDDDSASGGGGGGVTLDECATSRNRGQLTPVSMFVMMDNSLSMAERNKWQNASRAMNAFFRDPETAGLSIALRFFGNNPVPGCDTEACTNDTVSACASPQVELGELSAMPGDPQETALVGAIDGADPNFGGTPMFAALSGATEWAVNRQGQNPDEQVVVLFVTDGVPQFEDCTEDINEIAAVAAEAHSQGVLVYAIGLEGSREDQMDEIARAGGTGEGIFIGSQNAERDLLAALNQIRGEVASCDIQIPAPSAGTIDYSKVNVTLTLSNGDATLGQVDSAGDCADLAAWHYNDDDNPSRILLCPAACDAVMVDPMSQIDIVLGCEVQQSFPTLTR